MPTRSIAALSSCWPPRRATAQEGNSAIVLASACGHQDCVNTLIAFRADVNAQHPVSFAVPQRPVSCWCVSLHPSRRSTTQTAACTALDLYRSPPPGLHMSTVCG